MAWFGSSTPASPYTPTPRTAPAPTVTAPTLPETVGMAQAAYLPLALQAATRAKRKAGQVPTTGLKPTILGTAAGKTSAPLQPRTLLGA